MKSKLYTLLLIIYSDAFSVKENKIKIGIKEILLDLVSLKNLNNVFMSTFF